MKKIVAVLLAAIMLLTAVGCESVPSEVKQYANKHRMEIMDADMLNGKAVVGEEYVVYGTVTFASVRQNDGGRETSYSIMFSGSPALKYKCYSSTNMLKINKGDEVAFVVACEEGYSAGQYEYTIKSKIWENRTSEKTIEEEYHID